ncbi:hypothetical protein SAMN06265218_10663 [Fodinibius sediminis]|uniref:Uncharacterized protein n=1 Tax=Fodinibius sediminis TaxID=1214077 RepID=A0A521CGH8_9BACT|nr:hypothetical protein SAMN06265218_10663 [Fodinibius sediminis]
MLSINRIAIKEVFDSEQSKSVAPGYFNRGNKSVYTSGRL